MASPSAPLAPAATDAARGLPSRLRRLGRDYLYVLPGLPLAAVGLALLVALTAASLATSVLWLGALLMPVTLLLASGFARLSRSRLRAWGLPLAPVTYRPVAPGLLGLVRVMTDPRRWLDLAFEVVLAFPLRLLTFVIAVVWTAVALGGVTHGLWWRFVPVESPWFEALGIRLGTPDNPLHAFLVESGASLVVGVAFLLGLPAVVGGLARVDAALTGALLRHEGASTRWVWAGIAFPAGVLVVVGWPVLSVQYGVHPAVALLLMVAHAGAAVLAIRRPWLGAGLASGALLGTMLATSVTTAALPWPWPVVSILLQCLLVLVLAARHPWPCGLGAWSAATMLSVLAWLLVPGGSGALANGIVLASVTAGVALIGLMGRWWRQGVLRVRRAEELSTTELARRRDLEERNRIARELHDVVAHSMSVVNVQATTARYRKPGIDASVQQEFDDIAAASRQALGEMRALLALLRSDDGAPTAPVPGLEDIPELVDAARASGAAIADTVRGGDVSAAVGLTAYRIVQEALSNALRHAAGATIDVSTAWDRSGRTLTVEVLNSAPNERSDSVPGSGLGLAGIRERVSAAGGTVDIGITAAGGFRVFATLPAEGRRDQTS